MSRRLTMGKYQNGIWSGTTRRRVKPVRHTWENWRLYVNEVAPNCFDDAIHRSSTRRNSNWDDRGFAGFCRSP